MFWAGIIGVVVTMLLAMVSAFRGPTVLDRILAVNSLPLPSDCS